eukprot:g19209.t1
MEDLSTDKVYEISHIEAMEMASGVRYDRTGLRYSPQGPDHGICCELHTQEDAEWSYEVPKGVSSKLFTHWKGPYQIKEQTGPLNYKIRGYPPDTRRRVRSHQVSVGPAAVAVQACIQLVRGHGRGPPWPINFRKISLLFLHGSTVTFAATIRSICTMEEALIKFAGGLNFGFVSVIVGQPLDTIKTRRQAVSPNTSAIQDGLQLFRREGIRGLYRGGLPLFIGGGLMRSAQFGVNDLALKHIRQTLPPYKVAGFIDYQIVLAGVCGGIGRGLVEGPFEFMKVRRQTEQAWKFSEIYKGSSTTMFRNMFLFSSFVLYIDFSKQLIPGGLSPFWTGAICANLAWFTIWPLDVVKSQLQSGKYGNKGTRALLVDVIKSGQLYKGLMPGLARSTMTNGIAMVALKETERVLFAWRDERDARRRANDTQ